MSVHIRHGDKARETGLAFPFASYLREAVAIAKLHPTITHLFLATDDSRLLASAQKQTEAAGLVFLTQRMPDSARVQHYAAGSHPGDTSQLGGISAEMATSLAVVADILLLAQGAALVGTCTSGISRTASSMLMADAAANRQLHLPVAIDNFTCKRDSWNPPAKHGLWVRHAEGHSSVAMPGALPAPSAWGFLPDLVSQAVEENYGDAPVAVLMGGALTHTNRDASALEDALASFFRNVGFYLPRALSVERQVALALTRLLFLYSSRSRGGCTSFTTMPPTP